MPGGVVLGQAVMELTTDNSKFVGGLQQAARESESAFSKIAKTAAATAAGILVYKGLGAAIGAVKDTIGGLAAGFEQQLNILQAVSGAGTEQMAALGAQAKALGNDLTLPKTSAKDAAEAMTELGKAGLSINNIMGASKGVLQLAAAGNLSNARAAEIAANALNAFGLAGTEATRIADLLAAAANASSLEVTDAADAMQMSAAIFASAGIPIEDLITSISELGNAGIKGSDAGTSLKQMLLQLQTPTKKAQALMDDMGFSVYDASGNMVSMRDIIGRLQVATAGMTQQQRDFALGTIFGSDAIRSANVLIRDGVAGFDAMKVAVTKEGAAAALAAARNKGFTGALDGLKSAIETVQITVGSLLLPSLTKLIRSFAYGVTQIEPLAHLFSLGFNGGQIGGEFSRIEKAVFAAGQTFKTIVEFVREFAGTVRRELLPILEPLRPQFAQLGDALLRLGAALPRLIPLLHDLGTVLLNVGQRYLPLLVASWKFWLDVLTTSVDLVARFIGALTDSEGRVTKLGRAVEIVAGTIVGLWALNKVAQTLVDTGNSAVTAYSALTRTLRGLNDVLNPMAGATRQVADAIGGLKDKTIRLAIDGLETAYIHMLELDGILKGLANKVITLTQNVVRTGVDWITDFADKTQTITQVVVSKGAEVAGAGGGVAKSFTDAMMKSIPAMAAGIAVAIGGAVAASVSLMAVAVVAAVAAVVLVIVGAIVLALVNPTQTGRVAGAIAALMLNATLLLPGLLVAIAPTVGKLLVDVLVAGAQAIGSAAGAISDAIGAVLKAVFVTLPGQILGSLGTMFSTLGTQGSQLIGQIIAGDWSGAASTALSMLLTVFVKFPLDVLAAFQSAFITIVAAMVKLGADLLSAAGTFLGQLVSAFGTALGNISGAVTEQLGGIFSTFGEVFGAIWSFMQGWFADFSAGFTQQFTDWTETARGGLQTIEGIFSDGFTSILGAWDAFASGVSAIVNGIKDDVIGVFRSMVDEVRGIVNGLVNAVNGVIGRINSALTFNVTIPGVDLPSAVNALGVPDVPSINFGYASNIPPIKGLYEGGIVRHPMLATIAERGPEAVIPLSEIRSVLAGISAPTAPRTSVTQMVGRSNGAVGGEPVNVQVFGNYQPVFPNARNSDDSFRELGMAF